MTSDAARRRHTLDVIAGDLYRLGWYVGSGGSGRIRVIDVDASVGALEVALADRTTQLSGVCFEADPEAAAALRANLERTFPGAFVVHTGSPGADQLAAAITATRDSGELLLVRLAGPGAEALLAQLPAEALVAVDRLLLESAPGESARGLGEVFLAGGLHVNRAEPGPAGELRWLSRVPLADPAPRLTRLDSSRALYLTRRILETPSTFENWFEVLSDVAKETVGRGPGELTFRTRTGQQIFAPNVPGARVPLFEQYAEDGYRLDWFLGGLEGPFHALDFGAHVGTFACRVADSFPGSSITCFEPAPQAVSFLHRNIAANGFEDRIGVVAAALSDTVGVAQFDDFGSASVHSRLSSGHDVPEQRVPAVGIAVPTTTFDVAVAEAPAPVRVVKLDCEGGEYSLIKGSSPKSWESVERVVLEYHDVPGESWADLRAWFAGMGLHLVAQEPVLANLGMAWLARGDLPPFPG